MSYILDALRRAQAERSRGGVPGLHTAPVAQPAAPAPARGLAWVLLTVLAAVAAVGGWWLWRTPARTDVAVASTPPAPAPAPAPIVAPPPPPPPVPAPPPPPPPPAPRPVPAPRPAPRPDEAPPKPAAAPAPKPAAPSAPVFAQADLPPAVREQLPTLQLAGVTYSANPKHRMVIVNGQVLHEGDAAGPGLVLERIEQARTVWAFRGYRYALPSQ